jgi:RNA-directed DNA polymerase
MTPPAEDKLASVPLAKQAGAVRSRWLWTKPQVWTDRMLTALEQGVKGGCWFSLYDKVYAQRNLWEAFSSVKANRGAAGVDHQTIDAFAQRLPENVAELEAALQAGTYLPQAVRRVYIPKPDGTQRPLGIPTVRDRVVQAALRHVLEPIFERDFAAHSYGFRPGRGCKDALRQVDHLLKTGHAYIVDADLKSYFDTIPHDKLMALIRQKVSDSRVLNLISQFLEQNVFDGLQEWTPLEGSPQGAVISPLLSNIYLDPLDHLLAGLGFEMVRYADDFVILCRTPEEAQRALTVVQQWTAEAGLTLHPDKTRVVHADKDGFDFLGYHFRGKLRLPRKKSLEKFKNAIRERTKRTNGDSLLFIIAHLNPLLRGWFAYFKHSHRSVFTPLDGWVRRRLRSILRRRAGLSGVGRGRDHQRWKNVFFAKHGLFSLKTAHELACQSSSR